MKVNKIVIGLLMSVMLLLLLTTLEVAIAQGTQVEIDSEKNTVVFCYGLTDPLSPAKRTSLCFLRAVHRLQCNFAITSRPGHDVRPVVTERGARKKNLPAGEHFHNFAAAHTHTGVSTEKLFAGKRRLVRLY